VAQTYKASKLAFSDHRRSQWAAKEAMPPQAIFVFSIFVFSSVKKQISPLLTPLEKRLEKSTSGSPGKIPSDPHAHKYVKFHLFCEILCCIIPSGNTVQQHQCGKQSIAGRQTVHGVFCETITESCRNHSQIRNNVDEILPKFCNIFFIKRFALILDPKLIVLLKLTISSQSSKFESGGGRPMRPPGSATYDILSFCALRGDAANKVLLLA